jgi:serine/threonine protein kinase
MRALLDDFLERPLERVAAPLLQARLGDADLVATGTRIGPFTVIRELGRGGMGVVCLAEREDGLPVALKIIRQELGVDAGLVSRFRQERVILAALDHPGIARLIDEGVAPDGRLWLAMEYVEGIPIDAYVAMAGLDVAARVRLFTTVCDAVQHAHSRSIVHRDIKPSNILVRVDGTVKLVDFGIAKPQPEARIDTVRTRTRERRLTREYASPEQLAGKAASPASDVYALGVMLARLIGGNREAGTGNRAANALRFVRSIFSARARLGPECPPGLDAIIDKATRRRPSRRYANAGELGAAIRLVTQH